MARREMAYTFLTAVSSPQKYFYTLLPHLKKAANF